MMEVAPTFADVGKRMRGVPMLFDLDLRFRVMDRFADYQQVLSLPTPPIEVLASGTVAIDLAHTANDGMAELVERYPERFPAFVASLPLGDPDAALTELRRAVDTLGARGIQLFSNVRGGPLAGPDTLPLLDSNAAEQRRLCSVIIARSGAKQRNRSALQCRREADNRALTSTL